MAEYARTVQELVDDALTRIRSSTGTTAVLFPTALNFLNLALNDLVLANRDWRWNKRRDTSISTVAGTRTINMPVDCLAIKNINVTADSNERKLDLIEDVEAEILYPNPTSQGAPEAYISGAYDQTTQTAAPIKTIEILPTPDAVYNLRIMYIRSFPQYTNSDLTKVPPIPPFAYPALIEFLAARLLRHQKNPNREIQEAIQLAELYVNRAKAFDGDLNRRQRGFQLTVSQRRWRSRRYN
jgi:hypothetical protein